MKDIPTLDSTSSTLAVVISCSLLSSLIFVLFFLGVDPLLYSRTTRFVCYKRRRTAYCFILLGNITERVVPGTGIYSLRCKSVTKNFSWKTFFDMAPDAIQSHAFNLNVKAVLRTSVANRSFDPRRICSRATFRPLDPTIFL